MYKSMRVNFVGSFSQINFTGEMTDETHLAREIESLGHEVRRIPRDEWREYVVENCPKDKYKGVPEDLKADISIIAKWHHFYDRRFIDELRRLSGAPVFYWVWDFMPDPDFPDWHINMAQAADLYLSGEEGIKDWYKKLGIKHYYFQFDCADGELGTIHGPGNNVVFLGSCLPQGHRKEWLQYINKKVPVRIYAWNWKEWQELGFDATPAIYGEEANGIMRNAKINIGFSVEPNCFGYWSNRTGKVLLSGGFLLYEYAPGMEQSLREGAVYFSSLAEAVEKIEYYLTHGEEREAIRKRGEEIGKDRFSSKARVKELMILADRFLKGKPQEWLL